MSSPSRRNNGCGSVRMMTYRSPTPPPRSPALPLPAIRIRCPSRVPPLIRISRGSVRSILPSPWHTGHVEVFLPVPWHRGHVTLNFIRPPDCSIVPLPWHCGHSPGASINPLPWQFPQTSRRAIFSFITPPRIAVQNGTLTWYSRSLPASGPSSTASPRPPPLKMLEKISRNPPEEVDPPVDFRPAPPPRPPSNRSEKSNPPKSTFPAAPGCRPPEKPPEE